MVYWGLEAYLFIESFQIYTLKSIFPGTLVEAYSSDIRNTLSNKTPPPPPTPFHMEALTALKCSRMKDFQ